MAEEETVLKRELTSYLEGVASQYFDRDPTKQSAFDAFYDAFLQVMTDPLNRAVQSRDFVLTALHQLSHITKAFTSMASALSIEFGDKPVEISDSWSYWNVRRVSDIASLIIAEIDRLTRTNETLVKRLDIQNTAYNLLVIRNTKFTDDQMEVDRVVEAHMNVANTRILYQQNQLAAYEDQPEFVVARIDDLTKKASTFYRDGNPVKAVPDPTTATWFDDLRRAKNLRSQVVRSLRAKMGLRGHGVSDQIVVMQKAFCRIDLNVDIDYGDEA